VKTAASITATEMDENNESWQQLQQLQAGVAAATDRRRALRLGGLSVVVVITVVAISVWRR